MLEACKCEFEASKMEFWADEEDEYDAGNLIKVLEELKRWKVISVTQRLWMTFDKPSLESLKKIKENHTHNKMFLSQKFCLFIHGKEQPL